MLNGHVKEQNPLKLKLTSAVYTGIFHVLWQATVVHSTERYPVPGHICYKVYFLFRSAYISNKGDRTLWIQLKQGLQMFALCIEKDSFSLLIQGSQTTSRSIKIGSQHQRSLKHIDKDHPGFRVGNSNKTLRGICVKLHIKDIKETHNIVSYFLAHYQPLLKFSLPNSIYL